MRRFESYIPSQIKRICFLHIRLISYSSIILTPSVQKQPALLAIAIQVQAAFRIKKPIRSEPQIGFSFYTLPY